MQSADHMTTTTTPTRVSRAGRRARLAAIAGCFLLAAACSDDGGGDGAEGTYTHPEEGTITLSEGGEGTWEQEGNDEPFEFQWEAEGDEITFSSEGEDAPAPVRLEDGDLVLPPELISGDEDVTFERE